MSDLFTDGHRDFLVVVPGEVGDTTLNIQWVLVIILSVLLLLSLLLFILFLICSNTSYYG